MKYIDKVLNKLIANKKLHFYYFIIILSSLLIATYLLFPLKAGHDFLFHIRRISVLMEAMKNGNFPIYLDYETLNNYGYFTKGFYPDFVLIPFAFAGTTIGPINCYLLIIYTMALLCGIFAYKAIHRIYINSFIATVGALLYTFSYYKLVDTYTRSSLGETIAFTFIPLVFCGLYDIIKGDCRKWYILAIGMSLLVLTHNLSALISSIGVLVICLFFCKSFYKDKKRIITLIIATASVIIISAYYLFPLLELMNADRYFYEEYMWNHASGYDLYRIVWEMFSGIMPMPNNKFVLGCGFIITWTISLRLFLSGNSELCKKADFFLIIGGIFILMMSKLFPWKTFPFSKLDIIQFPWRLYIIISFFLAISGSTYLYLILKSNLRRIKIGLTIIVLLIIVMFVYTGKDYQNKSYEITHECIIPNANNYYMISGAEYLPIKVPADYIEFIGERKDSVGRINSNTIISNLARCHNILSFDVNMTDKELLELPLIHYIGYSATLNQEKIAVTESHNGLVQIEVNKSGKIKVWYEGTMIQKASIYISIIGILLLCTYIAIYKFKLKKKVLQ